MTLGTVIDRALALGAEDLAKDREFQALLQAPIPDALLSWKPGYVRKGGQDGLATFYPYIDDSMYRERLDAVCGMNNWAETYKDKDKLTECVVEIIFPSGQVKVGEGVAYFASRDSNEGNSEKGARTLAFRDACRHLGICGRDVDGAQTIEVPCTTYESNGKLYVRQVLEPLNRTILKHSGESSYRIPGYVRSVVHNTADPDLMRNFDAQAAERSERHLAAQLDVAPGSQAPPKKAAPKAERGDFRDPAYVWEFGKFKGKTIGETDEGYLKWCEEKADFCNPGKGDKYDEWLHSAVSFHLHAKTGDESFSPDGAGAEAEMFAGSELPEGLS